MSIILMDCKSEINYQNNAVMYWPFHHQLNYPCLLKVKIGDTWTLLHFHHNDKHDGSE